MNESEQFLRRLQSAPRISAVFNPWWESDSETDIGPAAPKIRRRQLAAYFAVDSAAQRSLWAQSGFAKTDLNFQLKQHGVSLIIAVGLLANTCIESPGRFAMDFGYHVTLVRDATAAFSHEMMHAAHHLNGPTFAHSILTTQELPTPSQRARQLRGSPLPEEGSHGGRIF